jgi:hypothetical protein
MPIQWIVGSTPRVFTSQGNRLIPLSGVVMIAKVEGEKSMVVIEKIGECLYSMCALKKDLKIKDVRTAARCAKEQEIQSEIQTEEDGMQIDGNEWWRGMMVRQSQLRPRQDVTLQLNLLLRDGIEEYTIPGVRLILVWILIELRLWFLNRCYSYVMNLNFPRQIQDMLLHHKTPYHYPTRP